MGDDRAHDRADVPGFRPTQLTGFRIGVTSDRRSQDLIDAFERRGAAVVHAPTIRITHSPHDEVIIVDTRAIIAARPALLLATTSYGLRRWFEIADSTGLGQPLLDTLEAADILVRGPKARGAIRAADLDDAGMSDEETTASLVSKVLDEHPPGITVAVQLHGSTDEQQLDRLRDAGYTVLTVAPYQWSAPKNDDHRVTRLIDAICAGQLDCVTFTSAPAVDALLGAAEVLGQLEPLLAAFRGPVVAAVVGPVTAAPLLAHGVQPIQPHRFRMGALIRLVCEWLEQNQVARVETRHGLVELRGSTASVNGESVTLPPTALALLRSLVSAKGAVVSRATLAETLAAGGDEHALEMALSRLRQALPVPKIVATVVKRGYRLDV
ncbi:uroporphyrinogen-III synthase [Herbiconiux liukaitaii]|uniref:uroporphyrinogen-III synthase n=1 Tax=Herbiconiux liukaitaii TaxID=3342799 RepID=UPI0035BADFAF